MTGIYSKAVLKSPFIHVYHYTLFSWFWQVERKQNPTECPEVLLKKSTVLQPFFPALSVQRSGVLPAGTCLPSDQSITGRSSPMKNTATVPVPEWLPMTGPMSHSRILPRSLGKRSSSAAIMAAASSGHWEWHTHMRWS